MVTYNNKPARVATFKKRPATKGIGGPYNVPYIQNFLEFSCCTLGVSGVWHHKIDHQCWTFEHFKILNGYKYVGENLLMILSGCWWHLSDLNNGLTLMLRIMSCSILKSSNREDLILNLSISFPTFISNHWCSLLFPVL